MIIKGDINICFKSQEVMRIGYGKATGVSARF